MGFHLIPTAFFDLMEPLGCVCGVRCRYGVFRRSVLNPIFHPYFFDYGGDKQEFYIRLRHVGSRRWGVR